MPPGSTTSPPLITHDEQAHPRRWLVLFAMTGSLAMILLDVTVVGVALTTIGEDLGLSHAEKQWVMNGYTLAMASLIALCGRLADSFGRVRSFVLGMLVFTIASAMCGVAQSGLMLVAGRAVQGVGAALMQPASSSIVIGSFAPGERGKAMGVYVGIPMLFLTLGPMVGGVLTDLWSWRACFFLNIPIALFAMVMTFVAKPDAPVCHRHPELPLVEGSMNQVTVAEAHRIFSQHTVLIA